MKLKKILSKIFQESSGITPLISRVLSKIKKRYPKNKILYDPESGGILFYEPFHGLHKSGIVIREKFGFLGKDLNNSLLFTPVEFTDDKTGEDFFMIEEI